MLRNIKKDDEILAYLKAIAQDAKLDWENFYFLTSEKYITLKIQTKEKYGFEFLDRIEWINEKGIEHLGSVVGEYNGCLYINLDRQYYCIPVDPQSIKLNNNGLTEFESIETFQYQYLGFYLKVHDRYLFESKFLNNKANNFAAKLSRNEQFIENTKTILKTSDRAKYPPRHLLNTSNNLFYFIQKKETDKPVKLPETSKKLSRF